MRFAYCRAYPGTDSIKKPMINLQIKHGLQTARREYTTSPTVAQIKQDSSLKGELGFGDNVRLLINGAEQPDFGMIPLGVQSVTLETAANTKAA